MAQPCTTIYDKLGGYKAIERMVADFYQTILNDDNLNLFYIENVSEISDLHHLMTDFLTMVLGGPNLYKGRDMYESHKRMPLNRKHFDGVWSHMEKCFKKNKVAEPIIADIKVVIYSFLDEVVSKK